MKRYELFVTLSLPVVVYAAPNAGRSTLELRAADEVRKAMCDTPLGEIADAFIDHFIARPLHRSGAASVLAPR